MNTCFNVKIGERQTPSDTKIHQFFVITGGPGAGKTTLLDALRGGGLSCMPEAGRAIIRDQVEIGGPALPWADQDAFAELMLAFDLRSLRMAEGTRSPAFFDRGIPDIIGYRRLFGLPVPDHLDRAAKMLRYARCVFAAPPWPEIYVQDAERKQTVAEAEATYQAVTAAYAAYGYDVVTLPRVPVADRAAFVLAAITR